MEFPILAIYDDALRLQLSRVMYGQPEWVAIGVAMVVVGVALIVFTFVRARRSARKL